MSKKVGQSFLSLANYLVQTQRSNPKNSINNWTSLDEIFNINVYWTLDYDGWPNFKGANQASKTRMSQMHALRS